MIAMQLDLMYRLNISEANNIRETRNLNNQIKTKINTNIAILESTPPPAREKTDDNASNNL